MLSLEEFHNAFPDGVVTFPATEVNFLPIAGRDAHWLIKVGLPRSAAPFLSFGNQDELKLPTLKELWRVSDGLNYRIIGSTGNGDPIAINASMPGEIVYLNHDNQFQRVFMNSSVVQLAEALVGYQRMINQAISANGPDAYLDGDIPTEALALFVALLDRVDPLALAGGMWAEEIEQLGGRAVQ